MDNRQKRLTGVKTLKVIFQTLILSDRIGGPLPHSPSAMNTDRLPIMMD